MKIIHFQSCVVPSDLKNKLYTDEIIYEEVTRVIKVTKVLKADNYIHLGN